ncbi:hypothetical protein HK104_006107 [Borealophlyctis nickersoniae]|nr:hypothetical protein HK104_006107 [Borealophlyctis nickersoniae]
MLSPAFGKTVKVLLLDPIPSAALRAFHEANYEIEEAFEEMSEGELARRIGEFNIVCIEHTSEDIILTDEVLRSAHRLLAIGVFSQTPSQVDLSTARIMGVPVFTSPYSRFHSVAELMVSSLILLARQVPDRSREIHSGTWNKISTNCYEVRGKTLGIVGYGHVGSQLGVMAEALSLRVIFYDSVALMPIGRASPKNSLEGLLAESDFVALNVSSVPENVKMFGKAQFDMMKPGSYLINASFNEAIDLDALAEAIKSGHLRGAAIDQFPSQPKSNKKTPFTNPLQNLPNVILTPAIGDQTEEGKERVAVDVTSSIVRYISDGTTYGAVSFPSIAAWPIKTGMVKISSWSWIRNPLWISSGWLKMKEIDYILSAYNVQKQVLDTDSGVGYLIADVATEHLATEIVSQLAMLSNTIRTRIL